MISEVDYASKFGSLWQALTPSSSNYVRHINAGLIETFCAPMRSKIDPSRIGLINEAAFNLFSDIILMHSCALSFDYMPTEKDIQSAFVRSVIYLSQIEKVSLESFANISQDEKNDLFEQYRRLKIFFSCQITDQKIELRPAFLGCGLINACFGDVAAGDCLYEIKAGDRPIRSTDLRQLLIYLALNRQSACRTFKRVCILNPRNGYFFMCTVKELCFETSGQDPTDLFHAIAEAFSSGGISR